MSESQRPMTAPAPPAPTTKTPLATWIAGSMLVIGLMGGTMVILNQFFAPKSIETKLSVIESNQTHLDWRIESVRVTQANTTAQVQQLNVHIARLLEHWHIPKEAPPELLAMPAEPPRFSEE